MEKKISNEDMGNQPAFGAVAYDALGGGYCQEGLTKRELFAAMAMQGCLASGFQTTMEKHAESAVAAADALITTLNTNQ